MKKGKKLYEGKAKIIYTTNDKNLVIQYFKDDATAFNNQKKSTIEGKGVLNNRISEHILSNLSQIGIKNHLVKRLNMREQVIKLVEIIPIEFIVRNVATGSITKRLGIEDGTILKEPLIEYCLKDDKLGDPLIAEETYNSYSIVPHITYIPSEKIKHKLTGSYFGVMQIDDGNSLPSNTLSLNQELLIPLSNDQNQTFIPYQAHIISEGDTLWNLGIQYKISPAEIARNNGLKMGSPLRIGKELNIGNKNQRSKLHSSKFSNTFFCNF